jgi:hypothetical protein
METAKGISAAFADNRLLGDAQHMFYDVISSVNTAFPIQYKNTARNGLNKASGKARV